MNDENPTSPNDGERLKSLDEVQADAAASQANDVQDPKAEHEISQVTETNTAESTEAPPAEGLTEGDPS